MAVARAAATAAAVVIENDFFLVFSLLSGHRAYFCTCVRLVFPLVIFILTQYAFHLVSFDVCNSPDLLHTLKER